MRSKKLLEAIVSTAIDGIITIDRNGIIDTVNPSALDIFGYKKNELIGQNISILMPEPYRSKHDDFIQAYLRTGQAKIIGKGREVEGLKKDGTIFSFRLAVSKVELDDQIIFAGFVHDLKIGRASCRERV